MMYLLTIALFIALLALEVPIAVSVGFTTIAVFLVGVDIPLEVIPQYLFESAANYGLIAAPMFILAGQMMEGGGTSRRLVDFALALVGRFRGGLAYATLIAGMFMGNISGSAIADTSAVGSITAPAMVNRGYPRGFAAAVLALVGAIGVIIPPSIPMIVLATICNLSIGKLFMGGLIPGLLVGLCGMAVTFYLGRTHNFPKEEKSSFACICTAFREALPALVIPVLIVVGIRSGIVTVTEVSAVVAVYSFLVGKFWYRELRWGALPRMLLTTVNMTCSVLIVLAFCGVMAWLITFEQIPDLVAEKLFEITDNKYLLLLLITLVLTVMGMFLDIIPNLMIVAPVLLPVMTKMGFDPIFFAVFMIYILSLGLATPPVGCTLFVSCALAGTTYGKALPYVVWFVGAGTILAVLLVVEPLFITWLPQVFVK